MFGWTVSLVVSSALVPVIGGVYGMIRKRGVADSRDGFVIMTLGCVITSVWLAAGVLTFHALH